MRKEHVKCAVPRVPVLSVQMATEIGNKCATCLKPLIKCSCMSPPGSLQKGDEYERWVVCRANYFTMVEKEGPGRVRRHEFSTLRKAIAAADGNPRRMIYAVMHVGRSVMLGPKQYHAFLILRGEGQERARPK